MKIKNNGWYAHSSGKDKGGVMLLLRLIITVVTVATLGACATPSLRPFGEVSAALSSGIKSEQDAILAHYAELIALGEGAKDVAPEAFKTTLKTLKDHRADFEAHARALAAVLDAMALYGDQLAAISEAGDAENAGERFLNAADGIVTNLGGIMPFPTAHLAGSITTIVAQVFTALDNIHKQDSLEEIMEKMDGRNGAVPRAANAIEQLADAYKPVITSVSNGTADIVILYHSGAVGVRLFRAISPDRCERHFLDWLNYWGQSAAGRGKEPAVPTVRDEKTFKTLCAAKDGATIADLETLKTYLATLRQANQAYATRVAEERAWAETRLRQVGEMKRLARLWRAEHRKALDYLKECGGFRVFKKSCGGLSFANLNKALETIHEITGN